MRTATDAEGSVRPARHTDRLRAGLTGLGLVIVVVVLTAANLRPAATPAAEAPEGETLAVLGVAPNSDSSAQGESSTADPAAR